MPSTQARRPSCLRRNKRSLEGRRRISYFGNRIELHKTRAKIPPRERAGAREEERTNNARTTHMIFDTIIRGGTVATASDTFHCDVGISSGRIAALGDNLGAANAVVDAHEKLVLPGGIDSHVHLAQPSAPGVVM